MLWKRILSALIPLPVILGTMMYAPTWVWMFLVVAATVLAHWEYLVITRATQGAGERVVLVAVGAAATCGFVWAPGHVAEVVVGLSLFSLIFVLARPGDLATAFPRAAAIATGYVYVPLLMSFMGQLHRLPDGWRWIYVAFFVAWMGDTGAYFAGRAFGRHKLYPRVSPKKTWEGALGGLLGSFGGLVLAKYALLPQLTWLDCALLAVLGGTLGQVGDLCESLLKRSYDVKDSGTIMPGHGGILDRADALMFVAPLVFFYATRLPHLVI